MYCIHVHMYFIIYHQNSVRMVLLSLFYISENEGSENLGNLSLVREIGNSRVVSELALPKSGARVLFFFYFLFFFLVVLVFCCSWAFSSYGEWVPLFTVVCGLLIMVVSLVAEYRL